MPATRQQILPHQRQQSLPQCPPPSTCTVCVRACVCMCMCVPLSSFFLSAQGSKNNAQLQTRPCSVCNRRDRKRHSNKSKSVKKEKEREREREREREKESATTDKTVNCAGKLQQPLRQLQQQQWRWRKLLLLGGNR